MSAKIPEDLDGIYKHCLMRSEQDVIPMRPGLLQELIERIASLEDLVSRYRYTHIECLKTAVGRPCNICIEAEKLLERN